MRRTRLVWDFNFFSTPTVYHICVSVDAAVGLDFPMKNEKSPLARAFLLFGGADGTLHFLHVFHWRIGEYLFLGVKFRCDMAATVNA